MRTFIAVVISTYIAHTQSSFDAPALAQQPLITINDTTPDIPAFIAVLLQVIKDSQGKIQTAPVILTAQQVGTKEVTVETFTEPVRIRSHHYTQNAPESG